MGSNDKLTAYLFWYKCGSNATTEYIYIIAYSRKQACFLFFNHGYTRMYDYENSPIDYINGKDFMRPHKAGDILGSNAII